MAINEQITTLNDTTVESGKKIMNARTNIFAFINVIKEDDQYFTNLTRGVRFEAIPYEVSFVH
ncbi:hypothetical protein MXB_4502 [Myxobolus squamalis]|nr:hypothetical protein MXB_4502 [Myxobolus squamalis]